MLVRRVQPMRKRRKDVGFLPMFMLWCLVLATGTVDANEDVVIVETESDLRAALSHIAVFKEQLHVKITGTILLNDTLDITDEHANVLLDGDSASKLLLSNLNHKGPVVKLQAANNVTLRGFSVAYTGAPHYEFQPPVFAAIEGDQDSGLVIAELKVNGGIRIIGGRNNTISRNDVSNTIGSNNGTCIQVASCGNATTLEPCGSSVDNNFIHDCRQPPGSKYDPRGQGIVLGGATGAVQCTVGLVVRNNNISRTDTMAVRISNDNYYPCVLNQIIFNSIQDWGQVNGGNSDSACLYMYGHIYSPGNNFSFNYCHATNRNWGQNGIYLDDSASGQVVRGNIFHENSNTIKLNGGAYNEIDSLLTIQGNHLGFANCRGLRGDATSCYTCNNTQRWMQVLANVDYLGPIWHARWPWYTGWCSNTTAGPKNSLCHPAGSPPEYECASLSRGNRISNLAGVGFEYNNSFNIQTATGFPFGSGICPQFVVDDHFNSVTVLPDPFFGLDQFVDFAGGDLTLRDDSDVYKVMPDFARIPFKLIGIQKG